MNAIEAYLLARAYTNQALEGAGALKGAACQIKSITSIAGGHRVTFEWEDDEGESSTETMDVMDGTNGTDGDDGVGIASITYKETDVSGNYVYTVALTDSNSYDITCPKGPQGSTGQTGATGNGIASIEKTSTVGLVDTYTITYTNGTTSTFTVTNGQDGDGNEFIGTTAEWNALTTAQKKEYDTYQLTDDYTEGKYIYLPTIYSEEEREVGVWKDGKPLYQKTVVVNSPAYDTDWHNVSHGISNIDSIIRVNGAIKNAESGSAEEFYDLSVYRPNSQTGIVVGATKTNVTYINNWLESATELWVTLQYTKTTDTAGSGTWTPTGQYAEHYSTDEQIIGTWVDGKTLYRKVIVFDSSKVIAHGSWTNTTIDFIADTFVLSQGIAGDGAVFAINAYVNNGKLNLMVNAYVDITLSKVVLEYTKPTV